MCAQQVIMISVGGDMHIGQSKSSPSCNVETNFCSNFGLFFTSASMCKIIHITRIKIGIKMHRRTMNLLEVRSS